MINKRLATACVAAMILVALFAILPAAADRPGSAVADRANGTNAPTPTATPSQPGQWQFIQPMPTPVMLAPGAFANGKFFLISGEGIGGELTGVVQIYDPETDSWSIGPHDKPTNVINTCAGVIGNHIYVPAGQTGNDSSGTDRLEVLDATTLTWSTVTTDPVPTAMWGQTCGVVGGKLYIAGGSTTGRASPAAYVYDPAAPAGSRWTALPPMNIARTYAGGVAIGDRFYVAGGLGTGGISDEKDSVEVYDPATNTWTLFTNPMSLARGGPGAYLLNGTLLLVCGGGWTQPYNTCESYDTLQGTTGTWNSTAAYLNQARRSFAYASDETDNALYAAGGWAGRCLTSAERFVTAATPTPTPTGSATPTSTPSPTPTAATSVELTTFEGSGTTEQLWPQVVLWLTPAVVILSLGWLVLRKRT